MQIDINKIWYSKNIISILLLPLSLLFYISVAVRRIFYKLSSRTSINAFVIVVGNITVGGTGKTPLVIWLAELCKSLGISVGVISRGYKRKDTSQIIDVTPSSDSLEVGDEALLISTKTACPVVVGVDRVKAAEHLVNNYNVEVILSDDGLQHYKLSRDYEIAVVDGIREFGNGFCLPSGPLREPKSRLKDCDIVISKGESTLTDHYFQIKPEDLQAISSDTLKRPLDELKDFTVHAVAGIANPDHFFKILKDAGLKLVKHRFPDHYVYREKDLSFNDNNPVLMTEKDAVKCRQLSHNELWYLPISIHPDVEFIDKITCMLQGVKDGQTPA